MEPDGSEQRPDETPLRALPVQLIEIDGGVLVVRGATEIKVLGDASVGVVTKVLSIASGEPVTPDAIGEEFAKVDRPAVAELVERLVERRILVDASSVPPPEGVETSEEIFYWHFGLTQHEASGLLTGQELVVIGLNAISSQFVSAMTSSGAENLSVVDFGLARNQRMFGSDPAPRLDLWPSDNPMPVEYRTWLDNHDEDALGCIVVTSDFAATAVMQNWNRFCWERSIMFLPIMLRRMVGHVGPLVVPPETACYECMLARENSHLAEHELIHRSEELGPYGQAVSGFHRSMASILGDVAALELTKFRTNAVPTKAGTRIDVNLLAPSLSARRVLRAPRCSVCSPVVTTPSNSLERADFIPGPQFMEGRIDAAATAFGAHEQRAVPAEARG
jgi:molybdopterin-synthase adenylyltransferase